MTAPYSPAPQILRAPEGTSGATTQIWLIVALFGAQCIPAFIYLATFDFSEFVQLGMDPSNPFAVYSMMISPLYIATIVLSFLAYAGTAVLAFFDHKSLQQRGVQSPFHWATSLVPSYGSLIYVIGRSAVVYRRTRGGLAPLWVFIGINVLILIISIMLTAVMFDAMMSRVPGLALR